MRSTNSPVLQTPTPVVQNLAILILKDFQIKNGVGPWMTRVRFPRMCHEVDFMRTNAVTSLDLLLLGDSKYLWRASSEISVKILY
ncbi:hypothetical protein C5167_046338 [Papaver somniferum]|uniref:Uncharacterized protein n=1 Tax=Papaver somniferum TaxID=3469 RepID=A0A4Y7LDH7_PAPSO|nr:hypothetical protein C5167_046338 [Papaver somniferum]